VYNRRALLHKHAVNWYEHETGSAVQHYKTIGNIKANTKSPGKENKGATNLFWVAVALLGHVVRSYPHTQLARPPPLYRLLERAGQQDRPITSRAFIPWSPHLISSHLTSHPSSLVSHLSPHLAVPARDKTMKHYYYANNTK